MTFVMLEAGIYFIFVLGLTLDNVQNAEELRELQTYSAGLKDEIEELQARSEFLIISLWRRAFNL